MSLKVKLVSMISAFVLVLSLMLMGVLAATNVTLNVGGNVSFTASSVYANITGSYVGTVEHPSSAQSLTPISIDAETTDGAVSMPNDWTNMPLEFSESASPITVTISIQNLSSDRAIQVNLTDNTNITNVKVERKYNNNVFSTNTSSQIISGGQTSTYTFILSVTSQNSNANGQFSLNVDLENTVVTGHTVTLTGSAANLQYSINGGDYIDYEDSIELLNVSSIKFKDVTTIGSVGYTFTCVPNLSETITLITHGESKDYQISEDITITIKVTYVPEKTPVGF